ncbi:hypothetical protein ACH5RR_001774 [Cinchona calisaya]|uniref:Uncharacterized protein n=1 Tax=Cinchona calisaya TaxID=153742 RepID=A0ABD3B503_9GENT
MAERCWRIHTRYERLTSSNNASMPRPRRCCSFSKKLNRRFKGLRLSRSRKLNWKPFTLVVLPRRIAAIYAAIVKRMKMDDLCPAIVFSCQWGLPVLSHSSTFQCRRSALHLDRSLAYS